MTISDIGLGRTATSGKSSEGPVKSSMTPGRGTLLLFCAPAIVQGFMHAPAATLIQNIYAKEAGLALGAIGLAIAITRIFDAVIDPALGWISDRWHARRGTRKPLIVIGYAITLVGLWFLLRPPEDVDIYYFTGWFLVAYLGWSSVEIPYRAWSVGLSRDYVIRTRIQTWLALGVVVGTALFQAVPFIAQALGVAESREFTLTTLRVTSWIVLFALPIGGLLPVLLLADAPGIVEKSPLSVRQMFAEVVRNRPLVYFIVMFVLISMTSGISQGSLLLYFDTYLGLGEQAATIFIIVVPFTFIGLPVWGLLCSRFDRQKMWTTSLVLSGAACFALAMLPRSPAAFAPLLVAVSILSFSLACTLVVASAMLSDVVDYGRWKFGRDHSGVYFSAYTLITKTAGGLGAGLGFMLLGWFGFDAARPEQTELGAFGIRFSTALLPGVAFFLTVPLVWRFPITRAVHAKLLADINEREQAAAAEESPKAHVTAARELSPQGG